MNLETINKWLENEYGVSYTRLEELHDFVIEQDLKHQEQKDKQIQELTNNWNELEEWLESVIEEDKNLLLHLKAKQDKEILDKMKEIKENDISKTQ